MVELTENRYAVRMCRIMLDSEDMRDYAECNEKCTECDMASAAIAFEEGFVND